MRISDIIAYVNHDLDDAIRAGVLKRRGIPARFFRIGDTQSGRIDSMVKDVIASTLRSGLKEITMSRAMQNITASLRDFLYEQVYEGEASKREFRKARKILLDLYHHYMDHPEEVFREFPRELTRDRRKVVCDFIAGMTDRFALRMYEEHFLPRPWTVF